MLDRLSALAHRFGVCIKALLHCFEQMLMLPPWNPPLRPRGAFGFDPTISTGCGPVAPYQFAVLLAREAIWQLLSSRATIGVFLCQIDKVLFAEAPVRFGTRRLWLWQSYGDAGLVAGEDLRAAEVAAIGNGLDRTGPEHCFCLLCHIGHFSPVRAAVRDLMRDDQMVLGIDGYLHVVTDHSGPAPTRRHRAAVGIGQGDLLIGRDKHLLLVDDKLAHFLLQLR